MKYKAKSKKSSTRQTHWLAPALAGTLLVILPFVFSFEGLDKFRLPKEVILSLGTLLLAVLMAVTGRLRFRTHWRSWEGLLVVAVLYMGLHTLWSASPDVSWPAFLTVLLFGILFFCLRELADDRFQKAVWLAIGGATGLNGILTVFQYYGMFNLMEDSSGQLISGRLNPAGFIGEVNSGGFLFGLLSILLLYYLAAGKQKGYRYLAALFLFCNLVGLAFSRTLTAFVGLAVCGLLWLILHHWFLIKVAKRPKRALTVFWISLSVLLVCGGGVVYKSGALERAARVVDQMKSGDWTVATAGRQPLFWLTWKMIEEKPLQGRGLNTFGKDFFFFKADSAPGQEVQLISQPGAFRQVHNEYLQIWEEAGLLGFLFFILLLGIPVVVSLKNFKKIPDPYEAYWVALLTIAGVFVAISSTAFFPFRVSVTATSIIFLWACLRRLQDDGKGKGLTAWKEKLPPGIAPWASLGGYLLIIFVLGSCGYQSIQRWRANEEAGVGAFLLGQIISGRYNDSQVRTFAYEALGRLERAEAMSPQDFEVSNLRGTALMAVGQYAKAVESYTRAVTYVPSPEVLTNLATAYLAQDRNAEAELYLKQALRYDASYKKAQEAMTYLNNLKEK